MENITMENRDRAGGDDITIYLVNKLVSEEANKKKKRKTQECGANSGTSLGEIHVDSYKLRRCSKYFETCMSERWTLHTTMESSSRFEFYLEAQTEFVYYQDCFSRMKFPFLMPMPSVTHCIELLKVATQIQYQDVVDAGMKYLAAVLWTADEEKQIRDFCSSGHFVADSASDLNARLDLRLTEEERQKKYSNLAKATLRRHLKYGLQLPGWDDPLPGEGDFHDVCDNHKLFADAFYLIFSDSESGMCVSLREYVVRLVMKWAEKILVSIKDNRDPDNLYIEVCNFCWLYKMLRKAKVSQSIVELIVKIGTANTTLKSAIEDPVWKWGKMMFHIFKDLLAGDLFLNTLERYTLLSDWIWIFNVEHMEYMGKTDFVGFISDVVLTFPLLEQEKIYNTWSMSSSVLLQSYAIWLTRLTRIAAKGEGKGNTSEGEGSSSEGEESSSE